MKTFDRRLNKLEYEFGVRKETWRILLVVSAAARELALEHSICVRILDEAGFLSPGGLAMVRFCDVPDGLNAEETKKYLLEHGAELCFPPTTTATSATT